MGTNYIAPIWRMPRNANKDKLSNYSINFSGATRVHIILAQTTDFLPGEPTASGNIANPKFSASIFFNFSSTISGSTRNMFGAGETGGASYWYLRKNSNDNLEFFVRTLQGSPYYTTITGSTVLNADQWYHACVTWDGNNINLYLDGQSDATAVAANNFRFGGGPGTEWPSIGSYYRGVSSVSSLWIGRLAQASVFNYELSSSQASDLNNGVNPMIFNAPPTFYYPMGDNSNITEQAYGGSDNFFPNISVGADSVFEFVPNDYIDCGNSSSLNINGDLTISAWVNIDAHKNYNGVVSKISGTDRNYEILVRSTGNVSFYTQTSGGAIEFTTSTTIIPTNTWTNIIITVESGVTNGTKFYFNGVQDATTATHTVTANTANLNIGRRTTGGFEMDGKMSNVQIWGTDLTAPEVLTVYNNGQPLMTGTQPQEDNLQAWYKLDQSANWEADSTGAWQIPDAVSSYPQSFDFPSLTSGDYIDTNYNLNGLTSFTVSAWFNADNTTGNPVPIVSTRTGAISASKGLDIYIAANGLYWRVYNNGATQVLQTFTNTADWQNVVLTYDGSVLRAYLNGSLVNSATGSYATSDANMLIGKWNNGANYFDGQISNVQVYNVALPSTGTDSIETLYNNGVPLTTAIASDNLKAWYKLNDNEKFDGTNWSVENQKYPANFDSALYFTGGVGNEHLETPSNSDLLMSGSHTFSAWIYVNSTQVDPGNYIFDKGALDYSLGFSVSTLRLIYYNYYDSGGPSSNNTIINLDTSWKTKYEDGWHHIVVSVDQPSLTVTLITDGTEISTHSLPTDYVSPDQGGGILNIMSYNGSTLSLAGFISNLAFYNGTALTTAQALTLYNNGTPENNISFSPTSWWKIDNTSTGLLDNAGTANLTNTGGVEKSIFVSSLAGVSSGMTEQNLVNNNVSVLNGESSGMNTTNLIQSNLTKKQPFSNYSMFYDAVDVYSTFDTPFSVTATDDFSWSFWVRPIYDGITENAILRVNATGITQTGTIRIQYSGGNWRPYFDGSSGNNFNPSTYDMPDDEWSHMALSITANGTRYWYVNGVQVATDTGTGVATTGSWLGFSSESGTSDYEGYLSQCAYWDVALTTTELAALYNNGVPQDLRQFSVQPTQYWPMNQEYSYWDGSVWVNRDIITNNDCTVVNTAVVNALVGNAPGSDANGSGNNLAIADLKGNMYNSDKNAYSINMADYADGVTNPANSGRSTDTP